MSAGSDLQRFLDWCARQVGTAEQPKGSNNVIYNTRYYGGPVSGGAYPWCCAFVWCGFDELGLSALFCGGEKTAYCPFVVNWARQHGRWVSGGYQPGDLLLYDWNGDGVADHIGVCVAVSGSKLTTVEGNVDEAVCRLTRSASAAMGAYRPLWGTEPARPEKPAEDATGPSEPAYRPGDRYMVQPGDSLWKIAERFLGDGTRWHDLWEYNRLPNTVIHPGDVIVLPPPDWPEEPSEDLPDKPGDGQPAGLPVLASGDAGQAVQALQLLLQRAGHPLPDYGVDGEFGPETEAALLDFQHRLALEMTGSTTFETWVALIGGGKSGAI